MDVDIKLKQKEAKTVQFTIKENNTALNVTGATFTFGFKENRSDTSLLVTKNHADFDTGSAANGIVSVTLTSTDLDQDPGIYLGELKTQLSASNIDKSEDIILLIEEAIITS